MEYLLYYVPSNLLLFNCGNSVHCSKYFFTVSSFFYSEIVQIISKSIEFELFDMKFITFKIDVRDQMIQINDTAIIDVNGDIISTWYTWEKKLETISLLWCDPV